MKTFNLKTPEMTFKFGQILAKYLKEFDVLALDGDLGAGKILLTQGLAEGLGFTDYITSPTFVLIEAYKKNELKLYHVDVYRLENPVEIFDLGLDEYLNEPAIVVIEWASLIEKYLPANTIKIKIDYLDDGTRRLHLDAPFAETLEKEWQHVYSSH